MANCRFSVLVISVVVLVRSINCLGYWSHDSQGLSGEKGNFEYDENPRIQVKHGDNIINDRSTVVGRYWKIEVVVYAFNETIVLNLRLNRQLFASSYVEKIIKKSGVVYESSNQTENECYYIGRVQHMDDSMAAVSICNGIDGYFMKGNFSYHIETRSTSLNGPNAAVYRFRYNSQSVYNSGTDNIEFPDSFRFTSKEQRHKRSFKWPQDKDGTDKVLELYIANDYSQFVDKGQDTTAVFQRAKDIANFASSSFQTQDIFFVLVGMEVWAHKDMFFINRSDDNVTLQSWNSYRMQNINPFNYNDHAVLITSIDFDSRVSGKSIIAGICSNQKSGSIVVDDFSSAVVIGSAMAHQIGHNFGLRDDNPSCFCPYPDSGCIMTPGQGAIPATNWSTCSILQFNYAFATGLDICLYDVPLTIYQSTTSTCGNGIIESGEQCDCGRSPQVECNATCCNPTTCQLTGSATCASGRCCDTTRCQIVGSGSLCRSSIGDCDLPEHCDGVVSTCPVDTYQPDGTTCTINGDSAYCYNGKCRSQRSQCELIWGKGTNTSSVICYLNYNTYGVHYGNCGYTWLPNITYIACQRKDALCGKLQCDTTNLQLVYYIDYLYLSPTSIHNLTCTSVIFDFGLRTQDPGLVPNGAACGDGKMCINQTCVNVSSLQNSCLESCRGDQVCNNLGHCQTQSIDDLNVSPSTQSSVEYPSHRSSSPTDLGLHLRLYAPIMAIIRYILLTH